MFEHVQLLLSFVYALALTHILASATELVLARDRVRFSGIHALWMVTAVFLLVSNWMALYAISRIQDWSVPQVALLFATAVAQYFTCSLVSPRVVHAHETDMAAFHERHRGVISISFASLSLMAIALNLTEAGPSPAPRWWITTALLLGTIALALTSGLAASAALRRVSGVAFFAVMVWIAVWFRV